MLQEILKSKLRHIPGCDVSVDTTTGEVVVSWNNDKGTDIVSFAIPGDTPKKGLSQLVADIEATIMSAKRVSRYIYNKYWYPQIKEGINVDVDK